MVERNETTACNRSESSNESRAKHGSEIDRNEERNELVDELDRNEKRLLGRTDDGNANNADRAARVVVGAAAARNDRLSPEHHNHLWQFTVHLTRQNGTTVPLVNILAVQQKNPSTNSTLIFDAAVYSPFDHNFDKQSRSSALRSTR